MNPEDGTYVPTPAHILYPIMRQVLDYYESDNVTLKPYQEWPGYYTLKNGRIIPCVFTEGRDLVPPTWKPSGIQCILQEVPEDVRSPGVGQAIIVSTWNVRFTNFGAAENTRSLLTLREIQTRMARLFSTANLRYTSRSEVALESLTARLRGTTISPLLR